MGRCASDLTQSSGEEVWCVVLGRGENSTREMEESPKQTQDRDTLGFTKVVLQQKGERMFSVDGDGLMD